MGLWTDLGLLVGYGLTFVVYLFVTASQILRPSAADAALSRFGFVAKLALRAFLALVFYLPVVGILGRIVGYHLSEHSDTRRRMIVDRVFTNTSMSTVASPASPRSPKTPKTPKTPAPTEQRSPPPPMPESPPLQHATIFKDADVEADAWEGIVGFFHPFCNAGGGGERVLWAAIKATQEKHPRAVCVVYTGDHDASKPQILTRVKERFNIDLDFTKVFFLYLSKRHWVLASSWPRFTLLGQSLGSIYLAYDAFQLLVPDVFIDTMGYGFALGFARLLFPKLPTGAYVHYPTISTDMLGALDSDEGKGLHAGAGKGWRGRLKKLYWHFFAWAYSRVGGTVDVVMTNSSWTQAHVSSLWGPYRKSANRKSEIEVVFPPCAVDELEQTIAVDEKSEAKRENVFLYIAQFRPEKNHKMILEAFAEFVHAQTSSSRKKEDVKLVLIGSVRDSEDKTRVYELRLLLNELKIKDEVEFICDASWSDILEWLQKSSVGLNGMWNEHFGIGVVEYQAAGLISVVNDSGGPKEDIVVDFDGGPTGYHASTTKEYADAFQKVLDMTPQEKLTMRLRARKSAKRFTEAEFARLWIEQDGRLLDLLKTPAKSSNLEGQVLGASYLSVLGYDMYKIFRR